MAIRTPNEIQFPNAQAFIHPVFSFFTSISRLGESLTGISPSLGSCCTIVINGVEPEVLDTILNDYEQEYIEVVISYASLAELLKKYDGVSFSLTVDGDKVTATIMNKQGIVTDVTSELEMTVNKK